MFSRATPRSFSPPRSQTLEPPAGKLQYRISLLNLCGVVCVITTPDQLLLLPPEATPGLLRSSEVVLQIL